MNRREAVIGLGALVLSACQRSLTSPEMPTPVVTMSVYLFSGWANPREEFGKVPGTQCPAREPWKVIRTNDREPLLGYYDERSPEITEQRLKWMESAGIGNVVVQLEYDHRHSDASGAARSMRFNASKVAA